MQHFKGIDKLTEHEAKQLALAIMAIAEKQYRKGFQHGAYYVANEGLGKESDADDFRASGSVKGYKSYRIPELRGPEQPHSKRTAWRYACEFTEDWGEKLSSLFARAGFWFS